MTGRAGDGGVLALDLNRTCVESIEFACAVFHESDAGSPRLPRHDGRLLRREAKLFLPADGSRPAAAVVNVDDEWGRKLASELTAAGHDGLVKFAVGREADYRARAVRYDSAGSSFECSTAAGAVEVRIPLPGLFNVYNSIAAIAAGGALGVPLDVAAAALRDATACRAARAHRGGPGVRRPRGLRAHAGLARERAGLSP